MKIALLNLPLDNNYGGNLQRYALMKVLQDMGHDVTHIYLKQKYILPWYKIPYSYSKHFIKKYVFRQKDTLILYEQYLNKRNEERLSLTLKFYEKYIKHTPVCYNIKDIVRLCRNQYDAYMVGSDQVWRKGSTGQIGLENYFLKFSKGENVHRYAYAVSFGVEGTPLSKREKNRLNELYRNFDAVSAREISALEMMKNYGWTNPEAVLCLDPTFLLEADDYDFLIEESNAINSTGGKIYAYVLEKTIKTDFILDYYKRRMEKEVVEVGLADTSNVSIGQWLNNIRNAVMVITDSFHGVVFSIIFRRPFIFLGNKGRGNARITSLFEILHLGSPENEMSDYTHVDKYLSALREFSINFLKKALQK